MAYVVTKVTLKIGGKWEPPGSFITVSDLERLALLPALARDATAAEIKAFGGSQPPAPPASPAVFSTDTLRITRGGSERSFTVYDLLAFFRGNLPNAPVEPSAPPDLTSPGGGASNSADHSNSNNAYLVAAMAA